jgi:bleomycin hydrolase
MNVYPLKNSFFPIYLYGLFCTVTLTTQPATKQSAYHFTNDILLPASSIKNQAFTNTCFVFSVVSLMESEMMQGNKTAAPDLSEMYLVRNIYIEKAKKFLRLRGNMYFTGGGELNDVLDLLPEYGVLPRNLYKGLPKGVEYYNHQQLEDSLRSFLTNLASSNQNIMDNNWLDEYSAILDKYLGKLPDSLNVLKGGHYPFNYFKSLSFNPKDYILLTSFIHHKYYQPFSLEVPDNWSWGQAFNLPLDDFITTCYAALKTGYSVAWDADDSEEGFSWKNGVALIPDESDPGLLISGQHGWSEMTTQLKHLSVFSFNLPVKEKQITPSIMQKAFDDYSTTDDHCMHIIGIAHDDDNHPFLIVKNSWGEGGYAGYLYVSESYFLYKSIAILVNKRGVPAEILKKLHQT